MPRTYMWIVFALLASVAPAAAAGIAGEQMVTLRKTDLEVFTYRPSACTPAALLFLQAQAVAQQHNWPFNWRLIRVPGVGHDAKSMFAAPMAGDALGLATPR
jgi:hypothetical protein